MFSFKLKEIIYKVPRKKFRQNVVFFHFATQKKWIVLVRVKTYCHYFRGNHVFTLFYACMYFPVDNQCVLYCYECWNSLCLHILLVRFSCWMKYLKSEIFERRYLIMYAIGWVMSIAYNPRQSFTENCFLLIDAICFIKKKSDHSKWEVRNLLVNISIFQFLISIFKGENIANHFVEWSIKFWRKQQVCRLLFEILNDVWDSVTDWLINATVEIWIWTSWESTFAQK